jgi:RimJ/RimL family protein N-acetyltransferase
MRVLLETERLRLRAFTMNYVDLLTELDSDAAVMHFINGGRPRPRAEIEAEYLPAWLEYYELYAGYGFWAAIELATGTFVGWFHLRPPDESAPDDPELGYRLRAASWGLGYASEGSRALVDLAFRELGAESVFAETMTVDTASRRVMEKAGLRLVRTFYQEWPDYIEGDEHGDVEYALTRAEWEHG